MKHPFLVFAGKIAACCLVAVFCLSPMVLADIPLDEPLAAPSQWGYRPADGTQPDVNPPSFSWLPSRNVVRWEVEVLRSAHDGQTVSVHQAGDIEWPAYTPPVTFDADNYTWRYRGFDKDGNATNWSKSRAFVVGEATKVMPLPQRPVLLARIPGQHPRLFVRPEWLDRYRELAKNELNEEFAAIKKRCDALLENPPVSEEPPTYQPGNTYKEELDTWWGNRLKTIAVLENAALLAFAWQIDGEEKYAKLSHDLLMAAAGWDPVGATGYRYNDEAGMPYNYHFSRTYSLLNSYLSEEERQKCREVMTVRGREMFNHLCPRHFTSPYGSHQNRAWHFLGEVGIAFYDEIPEAEQWVWFAMNVFFNCYPVWSDSDGGWHEGVSYWNSYQERFTWWADVMRAAFDINAFDKPYYSQVGYYAIYLMPPGRIGGGFGDLVNETQSRSIAPLVGDFAYHADNAHWKWYAEQHNVRPAATYYQFVRKARPLLAADTNNEPLRGAPPTDLPTSRLFAGTGQACLNTNLLDANENVQVVFKSSPFGTQSHGYEANNSFFFSAWNENLLINTGRRDYYGSPHHVDWMWSTRSVNNILVGSINQLTHQATPDNAITHFETHADYDVAVGEAAASYRAPKDGTVFPEGKVLDRYTRTIVFLKPDTLVVHDRLVATAPTTFQYRLHAPKPFVPVEQYFPGGKSSVNDAVFSQLFANIDLRSPEAQQHVEPLHSGKPLVMRNNKVACVLELLPPGAMEFRQTNQFDPNPTERGNYQIREWHLSGDTTEASREATFVLVARAWRVAGQENVPATGTKHTSTPDGDKITVPWGEDRTASIVIPASGTDVRVTFD